MPVSHSVQKKSRQRKYLAACQRKVLADVHVKQLLLVLQGCSLLHQCGNAGLSLNTNALQCADPCMGVWDLQSGRE